MQARCCSGLLAMVAMVLPAASAEAVDHFVPGWHPSYQVHQLQHANPYVYGLPAEHFRWGWFGAAPRWEATREVGAARLHHHGGRLWTHRYSY